MADIKIELGKGKQFVEVTGSLPEILKELDGLYRRCPHILQLLEDSISAHKFVSDELEKKKKFN